MTHLIKPQDSGLQVLGEFSTNCQEYISNLGLPATEIFAGIEQRQRVLSTVPALVGEMTPKQRSEAPYISKFIAACAVGLFDAALNFLWDAVIERLRTQVTNFDLVYFFDTAITDPRDRLRFKSAENLPDLDDWMFVKACHSCGLLSDIGHKHLDYIRSMRNWASAAHPNNSELTGLQLASWLETCIEQVFLKEPQAPAIEVRRLLQNLREQTISASDARAVGHNVAGLPPDLAAALLKSAFGLYTDTKQGVQVVQNINLVAQYIWNAAPDSAREDLGLRYQNFSANGDAARKILARKFLEMVGGLFYLPESDLALELKTNIDALYAAHFGAGNFYTEPPLAASLRKLVPDTGTIPRAVNTDYVRTLVLCRMGRPWGSGVAINADSHYEQMFELFTDDQVRAFVTLVSDPDIINKMAGGQARRYVELAKALHKRTVHVGLQACLSDIASSSDARRVNLGRDSAFQRLLANAVV